jgi:hypothetical protein
VEVRDAEGARVLGPFTVTGRPGREEPLEATPELRGPGALVVRAAFAASPEAALASLGGKPLPGTVVLRQMAFVDQAQAPGQPAEGHDRR